jgi:predicted small metal-binding protein
MRKIDKIYVDMDGVIANFELRYTQLYGHISEEHRRTEFRNNFKNFIETKQFATLELMPDARRLIVALEKLVIPKEILSSTAYPEVYDEISEQKALWLEKHDIPWKQNFVPGKAHKYKWATPNSIIIDDTLSVIYDWNKAGGIAIHHKNTHNTLAILEDYLSGSPK